MKKPSYKRELSHSYLVLDEIPVEYQGYYRYKMILRNRIPGLLMSSERHLEGQISLYYDISSRQSLARMYASDRIGFAAMRGMIDNLAQVQDVMAEYLLEESGLILEPEYIYMDLESEQLFFLYCPFPSEQEDGKSIYLPLAEFFLEHVDHREDKAVSAAYQFYKMSKAESFTIDSFRTYLEKGSQGKEKERMPSEAVEAERGCYPIQSVSVFTDQTGIYEYRRNSQGNRVYGTSAGETYSSGKEYSAGESCNTDGDRHGNALHKRENSFDSDDSPASAKEQDEGKKESKAGRTGSLVGLILSSILFLLLCALIWYLQPSGEEKIYLFAALAADGLALLIFLWLTVSDRSTKQEENEEGGQEQNILDTAPFWEEYADSTQEDFSGPTVYLGSGRADSGYEEEEKRPRLSGNVDGKEVEYSLERLPILVGKRKSRVQLLLSDASVSRIHARFIAQEGRPALMDMNSTNGTYVNGIRLEPEEIMVLEAEDEIRFGDVEMKYEV